MMKRARVTAVLLAAIVAATTGVNADLQPPTATQLEHTTVQPAARLKWSELVAIDRARPAHLDANFMPAPHPQLPAPRRFDSTSDQGGYALAEPSAKRDRATPISPLRSPRIGERQTSIADSPNFQALTDPGATRPPDTNGAVGPNHVMTMLNSEVRIQDKAGNVVAPDVSLLTFWSVTGVFDVFDPRLVFDQHIDRWLATCDANRFSSLSSVLFALSDTSDPTGMWTFYRFDADPSDTYWSDFPNIGFNRTWVAITNNMFRNSNGSFGGAGMWVIVKDTGFRTGGELNVTRFPPGFDNAGGVWGHSLSPCVTFDTNALASGFLHIVDNSGWFSGADGRPFIRISRVTGASPSEPTWSIVPGSGDPGTGFFVVEHNFDHDQILASQLGSTVPISTNDTRMLNAVYRGGTIWCTHTGALPTNQGPETIDRTAVFWYQLNPFALPLPLIQSGVFDGGAGVHHMFPSIAVNANFDAFIGFSRSDATRYVEAVFSQRHFVDAPGEMDPITVLKAGEDSYEEFRWGDYSSTVVDPADDLTFWTLQEYAATDIGPDPLDDRWSTWWGSSGVKLNGACCAEGECVDVTGFSDCQALFANCIMGPGTDVSEGCACPDFDNDNDVDISDFALFQAAITCPP